MIHRPQDNGGYDDARGSLFSYVDLEERIPARHPLRKIRQVVNDALASLDGDFEALYTDFRRAGTTDPSQPAPDPVLGPVRAAADGADAV